MSQRTEPKTRRGVTLHKSNPFIVYGALAETRTKRITNKHGEMMIFGKDTGELVAQVAGFWQAQEVDSAKFVKLYVSGVRAFKELTGAGTRVFEVLYLEVQKAVSRDKVFMSFSLVDQDLNQMSSATYKRGMSELIAKGFLAATPVQGWFWLNPDYMWNGDRLAFVKAYHRTSSENGELGLSPAEDGQIPGESLLVEDALKPGTVSEERPLGRPEHTGGDRGDSVAEG